MPRARTGTIYVEWHEDHYDIRFDLPDGTRSRRECQPTPARERGETIEQARARAKRDAKTEARDLKALAWSLDGKAASGAPATGPQALDVVMERWAESRRDTRETMQHVRLHVLPVLGMAREIADVGRVDIEQFVRHLDESITSGEMAWKTAANIWGTLTKFFDDCCHSKRLEHRALADLPNPTEGVRGPDRGEQKQCAYLWPREASALLGCADSEGSPDRVRARALHRSSTGRARATSRG